MLKATVTGRIWSTKKIAEVPAGTILEVQIDDTNSRLLAFDPLGCGEGEKVIIATGDTVLEKDDHVVLFAASDDVRDVERLFSVRLEYF